MNDIDRLRRELEGHLGGVQAPPASEDLMKRADRRRTAGRRIRMAEIVAISLVVVAGIGLPLKALLPLADRDKPTVRPAGLGTPSPASSDVGGIQATLAEAEQVHAELAALVDQVVSGSGEPDPQVATQIAQAERRLSDLLGQVQAIEEPATLPRGVEAGQGLGLELMASFPVTGCGYFVEVEDKGADGGFCLDSLNLTPLQAFELSQRLHGDFPVEEDFLSALAMNGSGAPYTPSGAVLASMFGLDESMTWEQASSQPGGCDDFAEYDNRQGFCLEGLNDLTPTEELVLGHAISAHERSVTVVDQGILDLMLQKRRAERAGNDAEVARLQARLKILEDAWTAVHPDWR